MVRSIHKTNIAFIAIIIVAAIMPAVISLSSAHADNPSTTDLTVNVTEILTVSITNPESWATGEADGNSLLRNKVTVAAKTNNKIGAIVSMYADYDNLRNTTYFSSNDPTTYIDTLDKTYAANQFPVNAWGYSLDDQDTAQNSANYNKITTSSSPVAVLTTTGGATGNSTDVFFGAKANNTKQSGTYAQTVNFVAVTGSVDPGNIPEEPSHPSTPVEPNNTPVYSTTTGQTAYTTRTTTTTSGVTTETTTTQVSSGNVVSSYTNAAGVTTTGSNNTGASVATALAVAASVAAVSGTVFFIAAKRRSDDEDEEE